MKIEDVFSSSNASPAGDLRSHGVGRPEQAGAPGKAPGARSGGSTDTASLSALGMELSRAIHQDPPEVLAKVARLQEAVSNGTYDVPASQVSAKIVASALKPEF